jgi:hypothetical protein
MILDTAEKTWKSGDAIELVTFFSCLQKYFIGGEVGPFVHCLCLRDYHSLCNNHGTIPCVLAHLPCKFYTMLAYNYGHPTLLLLHTPRTSIFFLAPSRPQNVITSFLLIISNFNDVTMFVHQNKFHLSTCQDIIIFFKVFKRKR